MQGYGQFFVINQGIMRTKIVLRQDEFSKLVGF